MEDARNDEPRKEEHGAGADEVMHDRPGPPTREATGQDALPDGSAPYPIDEVEEASIESFPASDPPGYGGAHV